MQPQGAILLALLAGAAAAEVKPFAKVVSLIEGLKKEVESEGKSEAGTYDKFACFCKDKTKAKSDSVIKGSDKISELSADIADKTQSKKEHATELGERKANQEKLSTELDETTARCAKAEAAYDAEAADLSKAISSLRSAVKAMKDSKPSAASLIAVRRSVTQALAPLAGIIAHGKRSASPTSTSALARKTVALLQEQQGVDPSDPQYKFHSNDIVSLCEQLLGEFKGEKEDLDTEWGKTEKACIATKKSLNGEMKSNRRAMNQLEKDIERLAKEIAEDREALVTQEGDLKDDELYLKDLTARCEERANDYDQRSQMRGKELTALTEALGVLTKEVGGADAEANERAFLQDSPAGEAAKVVSTKKTLSFLQGASVRHHAQNLLAQNRVDSATDLDLEAKKNRALSMLRSEGRRIGSLVLGSLTLRAAADPFQKVKGLIQKLIERLLEESKNEATKKGFCDEAVGSAEHERDNRFTEANDLSREIGSLNAKEDELDEEIKRLTKEIDEENDDLKKATEDRDKEKADNLQTIKVAKGGLEGVSEALQILKSFYSSASKASLLQASPVDEDTAGAGFSGSYKGKQGGMKAVFGLLEVIQSDFDRTIRNTEKEEASAHRAFVKFMQTSKSSSAGKSTKKELDEQDLQTTRTSIKSKTSDLASTMDLLDKALEELEELKPTCIDTGMSYKERVQKREDEIDALTNALCILDADKVESECQK